jgi:hypothetical protein
MASGKSCTRCPSPLGYLGNVAAASSGISRAEVLTLIQSQTSGTENPCHKCGKPGHWAYTCWELANSSRKSGPSSSSGHRQDRTNKHKSWRTIPPPPGTGSSKKVKDKAFNWCEKCCYWTVTHSTATHTGGVRCPPASAPSPRANLSMLMPDPSVWALDFPVEPETSKSNSIRLVTVNLISGMPGYSCLLHRYLRHCS